MSTVILRAAALAALLPAAMAWAQEDKGEAPPAPAPLPWLKSHEEAAKQAGEQKKLILAEIHTGPSEWVQRLEKDTLSAPGVQETLKNFILLALNARDVPFGKELWKKAGATGVPVTVIADEAWNVIRLISGYWPPDEYAKLLRETLDAHRDYPALLPAVREGKADPETTFKFLKTCSVLFGKGRELQEFGRKALEAEAGPRHSEIAHLVSLSYPAGSPEAARFRELALKHDPTNRNGYHDEYALDEALRIANARTPQREAQAANADRAIRILEARLASAETPVHKDRIQDLYWVLSQLYLQGKADAAKAKEYLRKGAALGTETPSGKRIKDLLEKMGG
jgi:hypothetical protein